MKVAKGEILLLFMSVIAAGGDFVAHSNRERAEILPRYVVFPGLDAEAEEIEEWNIGFASPFNVFFGPKPYVLGWLSENPFGPAEEEGEGDYEEDEGEGELGEDEDEEEGQGDYEEPGYPDYETARNAIKN